MLHFLTFVSEKSACRIFPDRRTRGFRLTPDYCTRIRHIRQVFFEILLQFNFLPGFSVAYGEKICYNGQVLQTKVEIMFQKYLLIFLVSMVPLIELRGSIVMAVGMDLDYFTALTVCVIGNMLPVPIIYFFARKVLLWGADKKYIGRFFRFCLEKGERGGQKLTAKAGRGGLFVALMLFVGIPLPGTGAWTGTLAASFLNMGIKTTSLAVSCGVVIAGLIMGLASTGVLSIFGL